MWAFCCLDAHEHIDQGAVVSDPFSARRETDVLANMLAADSTRIDVLVDSVGVVKGDVRLMRGEIVHVAQGVDELRGALTILTRHSVAMENIVTSLTDIRGGHSKLDELVHTIERAMPQLLEARVMAMRAVIAVVGLVLAAIVGLVLKTGVHP